MTCHHSVFSRVWNFIPLLLFFLCQFSSKPWSEYSLLLCLHRLLICLWPFLKTVFQASPNTIHHAVSFSFKVRHRQSFLSVCCGPVPVLRAAAQWKLDQTKPLSVRLPILCWLGGDRHRRRALWHCGHQWESSVVSAMAVIKILTPGAADECNPV